MIQLRTLRLRPSQIRPAHLLPLFDVPDDRVLHLVAVLCQQRPVRKMEAPRPHNLKDLVGVAEVRQRRTVTPRPRRPRTAEIGHVTA